jgi:acyl carrier protein
VAVTSQYLPPGYWRDPALTAAVFPPADDGRSRIYLTGDLGRLDEQGRLEHLGRLDDMVKIGGRRVELGCVELALLECDQVQEAVVVDRPTPAGDSRLVAYVVPAPGTPMDASRLRQALSAKLDAYMIPALFVEMEALPLLPLGKVNRQALPPPGSARPSLSTPFAAPRTPFEHILSAIWREVLGLDEVGVHDPFLELGGNSLQAMRIAARIQQELGVEVPQAELYTAATVSTMAALVLDRLATTAAPADLDRLLSHSAGE